jgi:hypothetical protein
MKNSCGAEPPHNSGLNKPLDSRRSSYVEFTQGGSRGSEASDLTSMGRGVEETGENRQILGVKKVSFAVLSFAQASEKTRFQGIRQSESLDAVEI